ncbi:MAG: aspartate carbamoyltransferase [Defluviitaleaceae bacterium]|nr:aspartate carbamoyltransferase [Defluviitaleaceae bacterium]MCL2264358.1 aspartate carbamoyltransferase [Defluviitaleaceae bacterium]
MDLQGRNLIAPLDLTVEEMEQIFNLAEKIIAKPQDYAEVCKGNLLATLFYEPSTRTRLSFEAAMLRLGGQVIGFSEPGSSSVSKGESIADTIHTIASYADIAVMRHPKEGAALVAARRSGIPIINAGDGGHFHPTQTLTDLLTIRLEKKDFSGITIGLCGDLKFGRTVHSLICAFARYSGVKFVLISPDELRVPEYVLDEISDYEEVRDLSEALPQLDVLYMTRVQRERFFNEDDYIRLKDSYILNAAKMRFAKEDLMVLHPLPRVNEISTDVDDDPRAFYFRQMKNGMYVRMALLMALLGKEIA